MERLQLVRIAAAASLALTCAGRAAIHAQTAQPVPAFDWRVPDRYGADGMIGVSYPLGTSDATLRILNPEREIGGATAAGWPAVFDACGSSGQISRFIWSIDGVQAAESITCGTTLRFPREGRYRVELTVVGDSGARVTTAQDVNIQDWLIIGLGDSYGSGEGVPNRAVQPMAFGDLSIAQAAVDSAIAQYQAAVAAEAPARAVVAAAQQQLAAAIANYNALYTAHVQFVAAADTLAAAQLELTAATAAVTAAKAAVAAATAKMLFECAQFWDPAGCNTAKQQLTAARLAEARAIARRDAAVIARDAAAAEVARTALTVPSQGWDYTLGVLSAAVQSAQQALNVANTHLTAVLASITSAQTHLGAANAALTEKLTSAVALWQDSIPAAGSIGADGSLFQPNRYSQCHQSKYSGQALAALSLERADPRTSVTFVHLACSGATIAKGLLGSYSGAEPLREGMSAKPSQLNEAADLSAGREIDALVTSIGGNDIGFASSVEACVTTEPCFLPEPVRIDPADVATICAGFAQGTDGIARVMAEACEHWLNTAADQFAAGDMAGTLTAKLAELPGQYAHLNDRVAALWPGLPADRLFLTQYSLATRDQDGAVCGFDMNPAANLPGISSTEYIWVEDSAFRRLNDTMQQQASAHGWTFVGGIADAFRTHGYCSSSNWVVKLEESAIQQAGFSGVVHPNLAGQQAYAAKIEAALVRAFYPQSTPGSLGPARVDGRQ